MHYALTDNTIIARLVKYNPKVELRGIYHDSEGARPIETMRFLRDRMTPAQLATSYEFPGCLLEDLPTYIETLKEKYHFDADKPFFIKCCANKSFYSIFPSLIPTPGFTPTMLEGPISDVVYNRISSAETGAEAIILFDELPELLERNDALALASSVNCSGAIELRMLNTIVFFAKAGCCFYLTYGPSCKADQIYDHVAEFNVEQGFLVNEKPVRETAFPSHLETILLAMQDYFDAWKARNYEGNLFPSELAICETSASVAATAAVASTARTGFFSGVFSRSGANAFNDGSPVEYFSARQIPMFDDGHTVRTEGGYPSTME